MALPLKVIVFSLILGLAGQCKNSDLSEQEGLIIRYIEQTRGSSYKVTIDASTVDVSIEGLNPNHSSSSIKRAQWDRLIGMLVNVDLDTLDQLESSTLQSATDRAAIAGIEIEQDGQVYSSADFDAGNPPAALKELVSYILELANPVE